MFSTVDMSRLTLAAPVDAMHDICTKRRRTAVHSSEVLKIRMEQS